VYGRLCATHRTLPHNGDVPTSPLLLDVPEAYFSAKVKVMYFGQETNGWAEEYWDDWHRDANITNECSILRGAYRKFYGDGIYGDGKCRNLHSPFWNGAKQLEVALRDHYRARRQTVRCLWNNIVKVGLSGRKGRPSAEILEWQSPFFDVIRLEVSLLAPDIVVFFTGPKYDEFIRRVFPDARFEAARGRTERQLARVTAAGLPRAAVRTYHPGYLWRQGRQGFEEYLKEILNLLRR